MNDLIPESLAKELLTDDAFNIWKHIEKIEYAKYQTIEKEAKANMSMVRNSNNRTMGWYEYETILLSTRERYLNTVRPAINECVNIINHCFWHLFSDKENRRVNGE